MLTKVNLPGIHGGISQQSPHLRLQNQHSDVHNAECSIIDGLKFPRAGTVYRRAVYTDGSLGVVRTTDGKDWHIALNTTSNLIRIVDLGDPNATYQDISIAGFSYLSSITNADKLKILNLLDTVFLLNTDKVVSEAHNPFNSAALRPIAVFKIDEAFPTFTVGYLMSARKDDGATSLGVSSVIHTVPAGTTDPAVVATAIQGMFESHHTTGVNFGRGIIGVSLESSRVAYGGQLYRAKISHVSSAGNVPAPGGNTWWEDMGTSGIPSGVPLWASGNQYYDVDDLAALDVTITFTPTSFGTHPVTTFPSFPTLVSNIGRYLHVTSVGSIEKLIPNPAATLASVTYQITDGYYVLYDSLTSTYKEVAAPGREAVLNKNTTPHVLKYIAGTWSVDYGDFYKHPRKAGDSDSNPSPDIVGRKISNMFYHRNRLCFLADNYVVMSRALEPYSFFAQTATEVLDDDPISAHPNSTGYHKLLHAVPMGKQLYLIAKDRQYILHSGYDALTSRTVAIDETTAFPLVAGAAPVQLETGMLLLKSNGAFNGVIDYSTGDGEFMTIGTSLNDQCPRLIPSDFDRLTYVTSPRMAFVWKRGSKTVYALRLHKNAEGQSVQVAWHKWTMAWPIVQLQHKDEDELWVVYDTGAYSYNTMATLQLDPQEITIDGFFGGIQSGPPVAMDIIAYGWGTAEYVDITIASTISLADIVAIDWDAGVPCVIEEPTPGTFRIYSPMYDGGVTSRRLLVGKRIDNPYVELSPLVLRDDNGLPVNDRAAVINLMQFNWTGGEFTVVMSGNGTMPERSVDIMPRSYVPGDHSPGASYSEVEPTKIPVMFPAGRAVVKLRHKGLIPTKINGVTYELDVYRD
jgi:hypothetical protein